MWYYETRFGIVRIVPYQGRFHIIYDEESLGSYSTPEQAVDDAAGGHTFTPSNGIDLDEFGLPDCIQEWSYSKVRS